MGGSQIPATSHTMDLCWYSVWQTPSSPYTHAITRVFKYFLSYSSGEPDIINQSVNWSVYGTSYNMGSKVTFTQLLQSHKHPTGHIGRPSSGNSLPETHKSQTRYWQIESLNCRDITNTCTIRQNNAWCKR